MRITHILALSALTLLLACSQVGCASAKNVGEEKNNFFTGTNTLVQADCITTTTAAKAVAEEDLKLAVEKHQATMLDGKVVARSATRMKLAVTVKSAGENLSRVTVRAGGFGNRDIQRQVLEKMRARLPQSAVTPTAQATVQGKPAAKPATPAKPQGTASTPAQPAPTAQLPF